MRDQQAHSYQKWGGTSSDDLIAMSKVREEFGLTDLMIKALGEPDELRVNPYYKSAPPMRLYSRARIKQWIEENSAMIAAQQGRKRGAQKSVETKRQKAKVVIARAVACLRMRTLVSREQLEKSANSFYMKTYDNYGGLTERGLCSYIRHKHTNYERILVLLKGKVGADDLYEAVKIYLCCRIIRAYNLQIHPMKAADIWDSSADTPFSQEELDRVEADMACQLGLGTIG